MSRRKKNVRPEGATVAIFVEGGDDQKMVERLAPTDAPLWMIRLDSSDPETSRRQAEAAVRDTGWYAIETVGVVLDAAEDPNESGARCRDLLRLVGFPAPLEGGKASTEDGKTGGWSLVPDDAPGGSETLLLRTLDPALQQCVEDFFACAGDLATTREQKDKARAWAWAPRSSVGCQTISGGSGSSCIWARHGESRPMR